MLTVFTAVYMYVYTLVYILQYLAVEKELGVNRDHANMNGESHISEGFYKNFLLHVQYVLIVPFFLVCAERAALHTSFIDVL
jgi:hypothetical protein